MPTMAEVYEQERRRQQEQNDALLRQLKQTEQDAIDRQKAAGAGRGAPAAALDAVLSIPQTTAAQAQLYATQRGATALEGLSGRQTAAESGLTSELASITERGRLAKELGTLGAQQDALVRREAATARSRGRGGGSRGGSRSTRGESGLTPDQELKWSRIAQQDYQKSVDAAIDDYIEARDATPNRPGKLPAIMNSIRARYGPEVAAEVEVFAGGLYGIAGPPPAPSSTKAGGRSPFADWLKTGTMTPEKSKRNAAFLRRLSKSFAPYFGDSSKKNTKK